VSQIKKLVAFIVMKLAWIPALLFLILYTLVINTDKVHKEFDDEGERPEKG